MKVADDTFINSYFLKDVFFSERYRQNSEYLAATGLNGLIFFLKHCFKIKKQVLELITELHMLGHRGEPQ